MVENGLVFHVWLVVFFEGEIGGVILVYLWCEFVVRRNLFVVVNDIFAFIITWASIGFAEKRSLFGHR